MKKFKIITINLFSLAVGLTALQGSGKLFEAEHPIMGLAVFISAFYALMFEKKS